MQQLEQIKGFFQEVKVEMKKVNWPTRQETFKYTLVVIGATFAVAMYLGFLDYIIFELFLEKFIL